MKIFDCFCFLNELEVLELRLMEMNDLVDWFVIAEANRTQYGNPKPFNFENNRDRFSQYLDKIIYVKVEDMPVYTPQTMWEPLYFQWNSLMRGLKPIASEGDEIIFSDLDEIPNIDTVKAKIDDPNWVTLKQQMFYYYVNCRMAQNWRGTVLAKYGTFRNFFKLRMFNRTFKNEYDNGGWHYSYIGGPERVFYKAENITERGDDVLSKAGTLDDIRKSIAEKRDLYGRTKAKHRMQIVDISDNKPKMLDKWLEKYPEYFCRE